MSVKEQYIPLCKPDIRENDIALVNKILQSGQLVQGEYTNLLEQAFCDYTGAKHAIAVSNGTASLHLALISLGIGPGDEVLIPAFSYVATANVVELVGATTRFVDISLSDFNIDIAQLESQYSPNTKAIIPVHEFGLACNISTLCNWAKSKGIHVIEDAACALGAKENGRHVGTLGTIGSFSLHPRKSITSGEGGIVTTNDDRIASKIRALRNHGIEIINGKMEFSYAGFNYRLTNFQAAMAYSQLQRIDEIINERTSICKEYSSSLKELDVLLPASSENKVHGWQSYHIILPKSINRDLVISQLNEKGIGTNYGAQCIPAVAFYKNKYKLDSEKLFPNAYLAYTQGLCLPLYSGMLPEQVQYVSEQLKTILKNV